MICALNEVFNGVTCVKIATVEEGECDNHDEACPALKIFTLR